MAQQDVDYDALAKEHGGAPSKEVNYDALAAQHGGTAVKTAKPSAPASVDYDALAKEHGGAPSHITDPETKAAVERLQNHPIEGATFSAAPSTWQSIKTAVAHPINYLKEVEEDTQEGGGRTIVGRTLGHMQARGDQGYLADKSAVAPIMAGPLQGPPKVLRGALRLMAPPDASKGIGEQLKEGVGGLNEMVGGAFQTPGATLAVIDPAFLPKVVAGGIAQHYAEKGLKAIDVPDEYAELGGNIAGVLGAHSVEDPAFTVRGATKTADVVVGKPTRAILKKILPDAAAPAIEEHVHVPGRYVGLEPSERSVPALDQNVKVAEERVKTAQKKVNVSRNANLEIPEADSKGLENAQKEWEEAKGRREAVKASIQLEKNISSNINDPTGNPLYNFPLNDVARKYMDPGLVDLIDRAPVKPAEAPEGDPSLKGHRDRMLSTAQGKPSPVAPNVAFDDADLPITSAATPKTESALGKIQIPELARVEKAIPEAGEIAKSVEEKAHQFGAQLPAESATTKPKPGLKPIDLSRLEPLLNEATGGRPLEPNVPLREQGVGKIQTVEPEHLGQNARIHGARLESAIEDYARKNGMDAEALRMQMHEITNAQLGEIASRAGVEMGNKVVSRAKGNPNSITRAEAFNQILDRGATPQDILDLKSDPKRMLSENYGSRNTSVTKEEYEAAKKSFSDKATRSNAGLDPTMLADAYKMAKYHLEAGYREFSAWAQKMVDDLGEAVRPHLETLWEATNQTPKGYVAEEATEPMQNSPFKDTQTEINATDAAAEELRQREVRNRAAGLPRIRLSNAEESSTAHLVGARPLTESAPVPSAHEIVPDKPLPWEKQPEAPAVSPEVQEAEATVARMQDRLLEARRTGGPATIKRAENNLAKAQGKLSNLKRPPVSGGSGAASNAPTFFSKAERVANEKASTGSGDSMLAALRNNGVKENEIQWMGLDDFLKGKPRVSKADLQDFIAKNKIELKDVDLGGAARDQRLELTKLRDKALVENNRLWSDVLRSQPLSTELFNSMDGGDPKEVISRMPEGVRDSAYAFVVTDNMLRNYDSALKKMQDVKEPQYGKWTLPGESKNYTEKLITLPKNGPESSPLEWKQNHRGKWAWFRGDEQIGGAYPEQSDSDNARQSIKVVNNDFKTSHFEEPNILAHVRYDERPSTDGKKTLFLEEVQSDWHQQGKQIGYRAPMSYTQLPDGVFVTRDGDEFQVVSREGNRLLNRNYGSEREAIRAANEHYGPNRYRTGVPDAPFKSDWHELVLKRMLREAAEKGFDRMAWTTGEQQAQRYDLSHHIGSLEYDMDSKTLIARDPAGHKVIEEEVDPNQKELARYVGDDPAKKLMHQIDDHPGPEDEEHLWQMYSENYRIKEVPDPHDDEGTHYAVVYDYDDHEPLETFDTESAAHRYIEDQVRFEIENHEREPNPKIEGLDLKTGGEWAKALYDRAIPNFLNKYAKKWGAKVDSTEISTSEPGALRYEIVDPQGNVEDAFRNRDGAEHAVSEYNEAHRGHGMWTVRDKGKTEKVHSIEITPAMKKSVLEEGQPISKMEPSQTAPGLGRIELAA